MVKSLFGVLRDNNYTVVFKCFCSRILGIRNNIGKYEGQDEYRAHDRIYLQWFDFLIP